MAIEAANAVLAGTLLYPHEDPRGLIVMVTGSGPHSRDQVVAGDPMFAEIAQMLADAGWASLRVDERGVGDSTGDQTQDLFERVPDVVATVDHAAAVGLRPLGILGHSEGALLAPLAEAQRPTEVDFLILLAAPVAPGDRLWIDQQTRINTRPSLPGASQAQLAEAEGTLARLTRASIEDDEEAIREIARNLFELWNVPAELFEDGTFETFVERMAGQQMRVFLGYDPAPAYAASKDRRLAIYGSLDKQTSPDLNAPILLSHSDPGQTDIVVLPDQDHFFQRGEGLAPGERRYGVMFVDPVLGRTLAGWLHQEWATTAE